MTQGWERALARAADDLEAASELVGSGHFAQAGSRAYFAAFTAASGALLLLDETRSKHSGVLSAFNEFLVKKGDFDETVARGLRWLFDLRNRADYRWDPLTEEEAQEALKTARTFVAAVQAWTRSK
ncbi:MAG: HEPN domain-containing protein [Actinomycetota bacterium]